MRPLLAVATSSILETEKLVFFTLVQLIAIITAPFMRYYFRRIGCKYELHADV